MFVFIGLDANYAHDLESTPEFERILEYHVDGIAFWRRHRIHHPFMLSGYRGDGKTYHRNFGKIGFEPCDAPRVSFVELLHVPTCGRSKLEVQDLDQQHLSGLNALIEAGRPHHIFVSSSVARLMRATKRFPWLQRSCESGQVLPVLHATAETRVYQHLHFSNYGKFQEQMTAEADAIRALARQADRQG